MTRRLGVIAALGLLAVLAAGGFAVYAHRPAQEPSVSPTWGVFADAQWQTLGARLGVPASALRMVTAMPARDGTPFAIVSAPLAGGRRCFVVVRGLRPGKPICKLAAPVVAFTMREPRAIDVIGLASRRVASLPDGGWRLLGHARRADGARRAQPDHRPGLLRVGLARRVRHLRATPFVAPHHVRERLFRVVSDRQEREVVG